MEIIEKYVHKSVYAYEKCSQLKAQGKNILFIAYGDDAPLSHNGYIWHDSQTKEIKKNFHKAIQIYTNNTSCILVMWTNKTIHEIQWLINLIEENNLIVDSYIYCKPTEKI